MSIKEIPYTVADTKPEFVKDHIVGCPRCDSTDNAALVLSTNDRVLWCSCGAVTVYDPGNGVASALIVHDFCPGNERPQVKTGPTIKGTVGKGEPA